MPGKISFVANIINYILSLDMKAIKSNILYRHFISILDYMTFFEANNRLPKITIKSESNRSLQTLKLIL